MAQDTHTGAAYLAELQAEKDHLDSSCTHAARLLAQEIDRVQTGSSNPEKMVELHTDRQMNLAVKVHLPVKEYPKVNFPGRLIGPKGSVMKQFQDRTGTKLCVFGRGSMTDKSKEEELRLLGGKYSHLNQDLHVQLVVYGHPVECYRRMSVALHELRAYLGPEDPSAPANGGPYPPPVRGMMTPRGPGPAPSRGPGMGGPRSAPYPAPADPWAAGPYHESAGPARHPRPAYQSPPGMRPGHSPYEPQPTRQSAGTTYGQYGAVADAYEEYPTHADRHFAAGGSTADWYADQAAAAAAGGKAASHQATAAGHYRAHPYQDINTHITAGRGHQHRPALY